MAARVRELLSRLLPYRADQIASATIIFSAVATLLMLQSYRVFISYMVFEVDQSNRVELGLNVVLVFAAMGLAGLIVRLIGERFTWELAVFVTASSRLALQFWDNPAARWILAALTVIAWGWLMAVLIPRTQATISYGIGLSFILDLAVRGARGTVDLPWMPGWQQDAITVAAAVSLIVLAQRLDPHRLGSTGANSGLNNAALIGLGSGISLWLMIAGNLGFAEVVSDLDLDRAFWLQGLGAVAAVLLFAFPASVSVRFATNRVGLRSLASGLGVVAGIALLVWSRGSDVWLKEFLVPLFSLSATWLTMTTAAGPAASLQRARLPASLAIMAGFLLQGAFAFAFFATSGKFWLLSLPVAVLAIAAIVAARPIQHTRGHLQLIGVPTALAGLVALVVWLWMSFETVDPVTHAVADETLTVMTYNIQEGFPRDNRFSLENTARTIEEADADIVLLQEVTRGWLVMSSVDQVRWLSQRLDMDYVYGGNSHDEMWGNAVLTRLPVLSSDSVVFGTTDNLRRGVILAELETTSGSIWVLDTHLDNPSRAGEVRLAQTTELLKFWNGAAPAIIGGDFNATPDSDVWQVIRDAGFIDTTADLGPDAATSENGRKIDYLFVTPDLGVVRSEIPEVWTSDHKPVVSELRLPP